MKQKNTAPRLGSTSDSLGSLFASLICILAGLAIGFIALLILGWITLAQDGRSVTFGEMLSKTWNSGFKAILSGGFYKTANTMGMGVRAEILQAAPLIMTGLSVAFAFKTGLFNIGAAGQYTLGAYFALYAALVLKLPWWACLIASAIGGAIWGTVPGIFKAFLNVNEVITSIMFNWIGLYGVNTLIYQGGTGAMYNTNTTKTFTIKQVSPESLLPTFNVTIGEKGYFGKMFLPTIGIFIAIGVAILIWVVLNKTVFGYELRACGLNRNAAEYAGINAKNNIILSMVISGAFAGLGGGFYYLAGGGQLNLLQQINSMGFDGISVALLANSHPIGCIFSAIFISYLKLGGIAMQSQGYATEATQIVISVIIYLAAFSLLLRTKIAGFFQKSGRKSGKEAAK